MLHSWLMNNTSVARVPSSTSPSSVVATTSTTSASTPVVWRARDTKRLSIHLPLLLPVWPATTPAEIRSNLIPTFQFNISKERAAPKISSTTYESFKKYYINVKATTYINTCMPQLNINNNKDVLKVTLQTNAACHQSVNQSPWRQRLLF